MYLVSFGKNISGDLYFVIFNGFVIYVRYFKTCRMFGGLGGPVVRPLAACANVHGFKPSVTFVQTDLFLGPLYTMQLDHWYRIG